MKRVLLRNKKTGEINKLLGAKVEMGIIWLNIQFQHREPKAYCYNSLDELNEEWEDYKIDSYIVDMLEDNCISSVAFGADLQEIEQAKECGLYFESKEEAEKAVEKLKALKRLKDKEFKFDGYDVANRGGDNVICGQAYFKAGNYDKEGVKKDLDLLFGGKE